jgi:hypothetical protein
MVKYSICKTRKLTSRLPSSHLSMEARRTTSAQKNAKNNLNLGQSSMRVPHKSSKAM